uniref:Kinesin-like protein n=1 Tax=Panagrolaimus sp. JU765 TaxID=591449 RepID=A0AC34QBQ1_9BILA
MSQNIGPPPLEVVCRIAPLNSENDTVCVVAEEDRFVRLVPPPGMLSRGGEPLVERKYKFAQVFHQAETQNFVFKKCAADMIEGLFTGTNGLLFAYGVTGSGKTYTMTGPADDGGILPRSLDYVFKGAQYSLVDKCIFKPDGKNGYYVQAEYDAKIERDALPKLSDRVVDNFPENRVIRGVNSNLCCAVFISYIEVYNDVIYDLFEDSERKSKTIRQDSGNGSAFVEGVKEIEVQSANEALELFLRAQFNRTTASTALNSNSSRSHSVFTIRLVSTPVGGNYYPSSTSKVHVAEMAIVDLAGSERAKRTDNAGDRMVESGKINQSLSVLRQCFEKLRINRKRLEPQPVPYRDCKLTMLFRSYFEGRGRIRMIICVNPCAENYEENVYVMNFAEVAKATKINQYQQPVFELEELQNLPYSQKEIAQWTLELYQSVGKLEPHVMRLFDNKPVIELGGPNDDQSIINMREYYTKASKLRSEYLDTVRKNTEETLESLKKRLCFADMSQIYYNNLQEGFDALRNTNTKLVADRNYLRKENDVLHIKLSKYEVDLANDRRRGEEENARVRQASAVYEKQRHALKQVENLLETPLSSTAFSGGDNVSNVAQIRKRFDRNDPEVRKSSRNRNASRPAVSKVPSAASHSARIDTTSFMNQRFHRRSKSAAPSTGGRVLDHQAAKKVPTGTIFQPALPSNTRHTTQPSTKDLRKSTDYVLNKQVVDSKGNLRTDLYKGKVIPTAGGGSAVLFDDVEVLVHDTPV